MCRHLLRGSGAGAEGSGFITKSVHDLDGAQPVLSVTDERKGGQGEPAKATFLVRRGRPVDGG
jgi:hypothetical protein